MGVSSEGGEEVLWTERKESGDQTGPGKYCASGGNLKNPCEGNN